MRMSYAHKRFPKKKAVNLSLSEDLIKLAKSQGLNISATVERALRRELSESANRAFCQKHADEIEEMREEREAFGIYSDKYGLF